MTDKQANNITKEQAIRILHPDTRVEAIDDYEEAGNYEHAYDTAILIAIAALRPQLDENGLARCNWCGPERIGWFSVQFWVRACYGKRKWMSVTQDWKKKVKYCPMCGRKLSEVEE